MKAKRTDVEKSLRTQLKAKGAEVCHFEDLVTDYLAFWTIKNKLQADIRRRGVSYEDYSATGTRMQKNNPSVKELMGVNRQMLALLKELGLSVDSVKAVGGTDDDPEM